MVIYIVIFFMLFHTLLFHILSHYGLSQDIEYSSLCSTRVPCLSILCIILCLCYPQTPPSSFSHLPPWQTHACSLLAQLYYYNMWNLKNWYK